MMSFRNLKKRASRLHVEFLEGRALLAVSGTAAVQSFTLINADTDKPVPAFQSLTDGAVLDLATLPTRDLNIRANTTSATVGSVKFRYDGAANTKVENVAPFALAGDDQGDFRAWTPTVGTHTLTATPYRRAGAEGRAFRPLTITFTVRDSGGATPTPTPLPPAIAGQGYHLAFSDEFSGSSIDINQWHLGGPWGESNSVQTGALSSYTPSNVSVSNGAAHLVVNKNSQGNWKGSILNTDSTFNFKYGYVEVRAQVPKGQGLWPAIWLYNVNNKSDEIDIMEYLGGDQGRIYQTYHYPGGGGQKQFSSYTDDWSAAYHTYGVQWTPTALIFYIDDKETGRITSNISQQDMFLMINNDAGGNGSWGGSVDASTPNPNQMNVDYVRIYQS